MPKNTLEGRFAVFRAMPCRYATGNRKRSSAGNGTVPVSRSGRAGMVRSDDRRQDTENETSAHVEAALHRLRALGAGRRVGGRRTSVPSAPPRPSRTSSSFADQLPGPTRCGSSMDAPPARSPCWSHACWASPTERGVLMVPDHPFSLFDCGLGRRAAGGIAAHPALASSTASSSDRSPPALRGPAFQPNVTAASRDAHAARPPPARADGRA